MSELSSEPVEVVVPDDEAGRRLDQFLARRFPDYSRVHLKRVIDAGAVAVDGEPAKPSLRLAAGQRVRIFLPELPRETPPPEDIPLDILYEDDDLVVVNKPAGMVVHPSKGHATGTLAGALMFHFEQLSGVGGPLRPGIVHRLDRETSGVIAVARHDRAHLRLAEQFEARTVEKEYFAIVAGRLDRDRDLIDVPIGAHPHQREKMAIRREHATSREAQTLYEVSERFAGFAALRAFPKTGRTHQIRLHLAHAGAPVLCDRLYGGRSRLLRGELSGDPDDETVLLERHALHARRLSLEHPASGRRVTFEAPLPDDLEAVLAALRTYRAL